MAILDYEFYIASFVYGITLIETVKFHNLAPTSFWKNSYENVCKKISEKIRILPSTIIVFASIAVNYYSLTAKNCWQHNDKYIKWIWVRFMFLFPHTVHALSNRTNKLWHRTNKLLHIMNKLWHIMNDIWHRMNLLWHIMHKLWHGTDKLWQRMNKLWQRRNKLWNRMDRLWQRMNKLWNRINELWHIMNKLWQRMNKLWYIITVTMHTIISNEFYSDL